MSNDPIEELKRAEETALKALMKARDAREAAERVEREKRLEPLKALAIRAHDTLCRWNHTDGCGWGYEKRDSVHDWNGWAHARWLRHLDEVVSGTSQHRPVSVEALTDIIEAARVMREKHPDALWILRYRLEPQ